MSVVKKNRGGGGGGSDILFLSESQLKSNRSFFRLLLILLILSSVPDFTADSFGLTQLNDLLIDWMVQGQLYCQSPAVCRPDRKR